jgi:putative iron-regulated protein
MQKMKRFLWIVSMALLPLWLLAEEPAEDDTRLARSVAQTSHEIIAATYEDTLISSEKLQTAISAFLAEPDAAGLEQAKQRWLEARQRYLFTETCRFCGGPIDAKNGPEEMLNSWPIDESVIDRVEGSPVLSIVEDEKRFPEINAELLMRENAKEGEKNITCGWHAIEFLLWGQDTEPAAAGQRVFTDYTTEPFAKRRGKFLQSATDLLVVQLRGLSHEWKKGAEKNHRSTVDGMEPDEALRNVVKGMLMLSGFELANERIMVACETQAQEEEQSCFSDSTNQDMQCNIRGMLNLWNGSYRRVDGTSVEGPSMKKLTMGRDADLGNQIDQLLNEALTMAIALPRFDQAILEPVTGPGQLALRALSKKLTEVSASLRHFAMRMGRPFTAEELEG